MHATHAYTCAHHPYATKFTHTCTTHAAHLCTSYHMHNTHLHMYTCTTHTIHLWHTQAKRTLTWYTQEHIIHVLHNHNTIYMHMCTIQAYAKQTSPYETCMHTHAWSMCTSYHRHNIKHTIHICTTHIPMSVSTHRDIDTSIAHVYTWHMTTCHTSHTCAHHTTHTTGTGTRLTRTI